MTTEAEEFKKQEERFGELSNLFYAIWGDLLYFDVFKPKNYVARCFVNIHTHNGRGCLWIAMTSDDNHKTSLSALRALNDRLELALKGKVKGA